MASAGAQAALRGYRLQALYTLSRLLEPDDGTVFQPEGNEDLDVLSKIGELLEANQVKAYESNLTLSAFDLRKPDSFFRRVISRHRTSPETIERVVSLGPIGPLMLNAWRSDGPERLETIRYFKEAGYTDAEVDILLSTVKLELVDIEALENTVTRRLRDSLAGVDPTSAFELLHSWIYVASEAKHLISRADLRDRISAIGRFVGERNANHDEWFRTIVPLVRQNNSSSSGSLRSEFYSGVSARYDHIQADVDIVRREPLQAVEDAFADSRLVVVHGASGQGKTALAYRYLHDFVPEAWRFEVRLVESRVHALKIAQALLGHLGAIGAPACLFIDVAPGETYWLELIRALAAFPLVRILVAIREEDWKRTRSPGALLAMREVELRFEEDEARAMYEELVAHVAPVHVLNFDDAWARFGGAGPLLEFAHFVVRNETLLARLSGQVQRLRDEVRMGLLQPEELDLLRLAAVATACGGRLNIVTAVSSLGISDPARTLDVFEREFLVRIAPNRRQVEGLHPIRSELLVRLLTDDVFQPWLAVATRALPALVAADLEMYLLHALARHGQGENLLRTAVASTFPMTWTAGVGILRALLWSGVRGYLKQNDALVRELHSLFGTGWSLLLMVDVGNVNAVAPGLVEPIFEHFDWIPEERRATFAQLRSRLTPPEQVLDGARRWLLTVCSLLEDPADDGDWLAMAEGAFWICHLDIELQLARKLPMHLLPAAVKALPLELAADVTFGFSFLRSVDATRTLEQVRQSLLDRFQAETDTPTIEDDGSVIRAHFLLNPEVFWSSKSTFHNSQRDCNPAHGEAMRRVNLLRRIAPHREAFGCQGYGHRLAVLPTDGDDTTKTGIPARTLPPPWPLRLNITLIRLGDYMFRPDDWNAYAQAVMAKRVAVVCVLELVIAGLKAYFGDPKHRNVLGRHISSEIWDKAAGTIDQSLQFPKVAVDEWGQITEAGTSPDDGSGKKQGEFVPALGQLEPFRKAYQSYSGAMSNFHKQAAQSLAVVPYLGRAKTEPERRALSLAAKEIDGCVDSPHMSVINLFDGWKALDCFQVEFRKRLARYIPSGELGGIEEREKTTIRRAFALWHQFIYNHTGSTMTRAAAESERRFNHALDDARRRLSTNLKKLRPMGIATSIHSETVRWEDRPALWLVMDVADPRVLFDAFILVYDAIVGALQGIRPYELAQCAVLQAWSSIHILPFAGGRLVELASWQLATITVIGLPEREAEIPWWHAALQPIPIPILGSLEIPLPDWPSLDVFDRTVARTRDLVLVVSSMNSVAKIPAPTGNGAEVLRKYLAVRSREVSAVLTDVRHALSDLNRNLVCTGTQTEIGEQATYELTCATQLISELVSPAQLQGLSSGEMVLTFTEVAAWEESIQAALLSLQSVRLSGLALMLQESNPMQIAWLLEPG